MVKRVFILVALLVISSTPLRAVQRTVLAEDFTGTWCQYCPGAQMGLQILKSQVRDSLAILAYHLNDPFTVPECNTRSSYYGVSGIPHVKFDGVLTRVGGYYNQPVDYRDLFNIRQTVPAPVQITLANATFNLITGNGEVSVTVRNNSTTAISGNLRLAMVGKETTYAWQSQSRLYDVVLGMFPNAANGEFVSLNVNETFSRSYNYTIPAAWRNMPCAIVAFLQDDVSKEVYNAYELDTRPNCIGEDNAWSIQNQKFVTFSNPVSDQAKFYFNINSTAIFNLSIYDSSGRLINTLTNSSRSNEIVWNLTDQKDRSVKPGIYFIQFKINNQKYMDKLVVAK
ncbi:MAG: Omp28-related outer membrane protein [candidate division WOR-3 bacterium]